MALGSTQPVTEMSTRNLPRGKGRPARKADNLTNICEPIVETECGSLDVSQPYGLSRLVTGIAFYLLQNLTVDHQVNKLSIFTEPEGSLTFSQEPFADFRLETNESIPQVDILFL
jgi:hypothetical protein